MTTNTTGTIEAVSERAACTVLLNEKAGALHLTPGADEIRRMLDQFGIAAEVVTTGSPAELTGRVRELRDRRAPRVVVAGGDGTVGLAVQVLAESDTALGIIPQGTANNFANALRLPMDLPSALRLLKEGRSIRVDLGFVNGRYFTEAAGVGLFADALSLYGHTANKNLFRSLYAVAKIVFSLHPHRVRLTMDGETIVERAAYCAAANSFRIGHAMAIAPDAKITDGQLDVVVFGDLTRRDLIPYYRALRAQMHLSLPKTSTYKAREVRFESARPMVVHADGGIVGTTPVTIQVKPKALKVLVDVL